jgi:hypothetical protein
VPSPIPAINEPCTRFESPTQPLAVEVWVDDGSARPTWCFGTLREWAHYNSVGWTAFVQYSTEPGTNYLGRFLAKHVREHH